MFKKADGVIPDSSWRLLFRWYSSMEVKVQWNGSFGPPIAVKRGTRQGGLTSPFIFNIFYQEMIAELNAAECGVMINGATFNVYCYADDVLLASTTTTGLQKLIDIASTYVDQHGLRFNPAKTTCMTFGKQRLDSDPSWTIGGSSLSHEDCLLYLGTMLKNDLGEAHIHRRVQAAQRAFYSLQGAGLHFGGLAPEVAADLYSVGVRTVLLFGCEAIHAKTSTLKKLESAQGKFVKSILGLPKHSKNTPVVSALKIPSIRQSVGLSCMKLLRSCILHHSNASAFYTHLLCNPSHVSPQSLVSRALTHAKELNVDFIKFLFNDQYYRLNSKVVCPSDGISDSIQTLLLDFNASARDLIKMLSSPF